MQTHDYKPNVTQYKDLKYEFVFCMKVCVKTKADSLQPCGKAILDLLSVKGACKIGHPVKKSNEY